MMNMIGTIWSYFACAWTTTEQRGREFYLMSERLWCSRTGNKTICCVCLLASRCSRAFETSGRRGVQRETRRRISRRVGARAETQAHAGTGNRDVKNFRRGESRDLGVIVCRRYRHNAVVYRVFFAVNAYRAAFCKIGR